MVIEIYKPPDGPPFVTITKGGETFKGPWVMNHQILTVASSLNVWLLITRAIEQLPVTRITLEP